jgi:hypothetical protein
MLQRKQSIWLFLAALCNAGVFYFDFYRYHVMDNGVDTVKYLRVSDHYPSLLIALVMTILPLITIFMFGNRKRQMSMSAMSIFIIGAFIAMTLNRVTNIRTLVPPPTSESYWIGGVLPIISIIFLIMAIFGIRKDDKLVRSADRLR